MTAHPNDWQQRYHEAVEALAEAWAEGYLQGAQDIRKNEFTRNPYAKKEN